MPRSSLQSPRGIAPILMPLAGMLLALLAGCAHPSTTRQAEPGPAPPRDTTTAAELTSREMERRPNERIATMLETRTPGVSVSVSPAGIVSVRIQGAASFYGGTEPLYVIDGTQFTPGPGGSLAGINPEDIESIQVLKYPAETAIYGVRGANGVILITTKRPKR